MQNRNLVAISILLILILTLAFLQTPIMSRARAATWGTIIQFIATSTGNPIDDSSLQDQLASLQAENLRLRAEHRDYEHLRAQLGTNTFEQLRSIPAAVVGRPLDTFHSQYIINKGLADGVSLHAPAVLHGSTLVGFVQEVSEHTATIELLFHPSTQLTVEALNEDQDIPAARGLLESRYYTSLFLTTVPHDMQLHEGQEVVTVGRETEIPHGLGIGVISEIISTEYEPYQQARITTSYDVDNIDAVQILVAP